MIATLYLKHGKTQQQIAKIMKLSQKQISNIVNDSNISNADNPGDKRRKLSKEDYPVIARLILGGEKQADIAKKFDVSQGRISQVWAEFRDKIHLLLILYSGIERHYSDKSQPVGF